jgi:hypothetical protein
VSAANKKLSLILYHLANEPSVGLYHVNEHVTRSVPRVVQMKNQLKSQVKAVIDLNIDMDSTLETVQSLGKLDTFGSISRLLMHASQTVDDIYNGRPAPVSVSDDIEAAKALPASESASGPAVDQSNQPQGAPHIPTVE